MVQTSREKPSSRPMLALAAASWLIAAISGVVALAARVVDPPPILPNNFGLGEATVVAFVLHGLAFATAGAVLVVRRPANAVGRRLILVGLSYSLSMVTSAIVFAAWADGTPEGREVAAAAAWWTVALTTIAGFAYIDLALIFPTGRSHSPAWARFRRVALVSMLVLTALIVTVPGRMSIFPAIDNPIGLGPDVRALFGERTLIILIGIGSVVLGPVPIAAVVSRYRAAGVVERQQLRWFISALATSVGSLGLAAFLSIVDRPLGEAPLFLYALTGTAVPVAIGIAILRYRLYEIDRLIGRTLAYGLVSAVLAGAYALTVLSLGSLLGSLAPGGTLAVAGSTLVVVALFGPVRRWAQALVDRRFDRPRFDAARTIAALADRLRNEIHPERVESDILGVVGDTFHPDQAGIWLRKAASTAAPMPTER